MARRLFGWVLALLCFVLMTVRMDAETMTFRVDPAKTTIAFLVGATLHTVRGTFRLKSGEVEFDGTAQSARGEFVVEIESGTTGNKSRDRQMKRDILEASKYPEARFSVQKMTGDLVTSGTSTVHLTGTFFIHGSRYELTIPAEVTVAGDQVTAHMHFMLPYVQWGMKSPSVFLLRVDDKAIVEIEAVGRLVH